MQSIDAHGDFSLTPFIDALIGLYPDREACIRRMASEDTGPALADYDVYGARMDTGARVNGFPVWRYLRNDVHVCETAAGGITLYRWVEHDPEPCL
ncbi:hypothetical protein AB4Y43_17150 [Paraburkholderia sp. BR10872]|uniref:hypothetical protein n=1 Tax=Paraburkholderia sp. BR10872 TaxID=3236989 RepID=UPI0034D29ECA